jgi:hypothetical protein
LDLIPKQYKSGNSEQPEPAEIQLKSRGISIYGKQSELLSLLLNKWVIICLAGVLLALLVFGGINIYNFYAKKNIAGLEKEIKQVQSEQDAELVKKIIELDKSMGTVSGLLKNHIFSSLFFENLERLTIAQVQWLGVNLNTLSGTAELRGKAFSYSFLAKQIVSFQEQKIQIDVSNIALRKDGVDFLAKIKFDPKILLK